MKRAILFILILVLAVPGAFAKGPHKGETPESTGKGDDGGFYIGLGSGVDLPGSKWDSNYELGGGTDVFAGFQLDRNLAAQLDVQELFFTGGGSSLNNVRVTAQAKYAFEGKDFQPYILAGPGLVFQNLSPSGDSTTNFDALGGLGIQFDLAPRTHLFVEAKYNFIMSQTTTFSDVPVSAGLWVGL